jgi:hypothetical protein
MAQGKLGTVSRQRACALEIYWHTGMLFETCSWCAMFIVRGIQQGGGERVVVKRRTLEQDPRESRIEYMQ